MTAACDAVSIASRSTGCVTAILLILVNCTGASKPALTPVPRGIVASVPVLDTTTPVDGLEQEIKYLKSLMPAKIDHEFINEVAKILHKYSHNHNHNQNQNHAQSYLHNQSYDHDQSYNHDQNHNQNHNQTHINSNSNASLLSKADLQHLNNQLHKIDHFFNGQQAGIVNTINQEIRHLKQHRFVEREGMKFYNAKSYLEHLTQDKLLAPYLRNTSIHGQLDRINKAQEREMQMEKRMSRSMDEGFSM